MIIYLPKIGIHFWVNDTRIMKQQKVNLSRAKKIKNVLNQWKSIINFGSKHLTLRIDLVYIEIPISFRQRKKNTDQFWSKAFRL